MAKKSRDKGAAGEREVAKIMKDLTGVELKRNLTQYQNSGESDLLGIDWAAIEVKRHRTALDAQIYSWWNETVEQARRVNKVPVLIYRPDKQAWKVVMPRTGFNDYDFMPFDCTMTITLLGLAGIVSAKLEANAA